jgi:hypothetical protein
MPQSQKSRSKTKEVRVSSRVLLSPISQVSLLEFLVLLFLIFIASRLLGRRPSVLQRSKTTLSSVVDESGHVCLLSSVASVQLGWCVHEWSFCPSIDRRPDISSAWLPPVSHSKDRQGMKSDLTKRLKRLMFYSHPSNLTMRRCYKP